MIGEWPFFLFNQILWSARTCKIRSPHVARAAITGRHITVGSGSRIDAASAIGGYTYIGCNSAITKSRIGRYVSIANNVSIGQGEHDYTKVSTSAFFDAAPWETLTRGCCEVGDDVWIGVDAGVLRGVQIGVGAVVAANAVVTRDVPPYAIVIGVPARVVKYRFDEATRQKLLESQWWSRNIDDARAVVKALQRDLDTQ